VSPPTSETSSERLASIFRWVVAHRWWVVAFYAALLPACVYFAIKVKQDNSLDRLVVKSDPDYINNQAFSKVFGSGSYVVLLAEAPDPFAPEVVRKLDGLSRALDQIPHVEDTSILAVFRRIKNGFNGTPEEIAAFKKFALGTQLFAKQGLVGENFLGLPLMLSTNTTAERQQLLDEIEKVIGPIEARPAPLSSLVKVGEPYVDHYLDSESQKNATRSFPLFVLFAVVLNLTLYRSFRTLIAFLVTLAVSAATAVGFVGVTGGTFTILSSVMPMTILITTTATLVYLHSRFVDHPEDTPVDEHQIFALTNKFLACTASIFATGVGFAALAVSQIRPIRELGLWVAVGLLIAWIIIFTLFPALQKILGTPTEQERKAAGQWFVNFTTWLPRWTYRYRWVLVPGALLLSAGGAVALFGLPHVIAPMELETNPIEYIPRDSDLYKNTKRLEKKIGGLSLTEVWLSGKFGAVSDAESLRGFEKLQSLLESDPLVGSVVGPTTVLRIMRYVQGQGDTLPTTNDGLEAVAAQLEQLHQSQPMLSRFVTKDFSQTHFVVLSQTVDWASFERLDDHIRKHFAEAQAQVPALKQFTLVIAGLAPLQAKISHHLVPTLVESFALTVVIIFGTFLLVFRNGAARLMAMIPSLFAILVMFGIMRVTGMSLNITTILIASTVLGTSENDQIHFFYHFLEKRDQSTEQGLRHTLNVAGRAIFFATLINAGGFLAFAVAKLPPVHEFGLLSCVAFVLSMVADFTALPAALWMIFREKPDAK
jgi:predicted RND superfamily exporter protein